MKLAGGSHEIALRLRQITLYNSLAMLKLLYTIMDHIYNKGAGELIIP